MRLGPLPRAEAEAEVRWVNGGCCSKASRVGDTRAYSRLIRIDAPKFFINFYFLQIFFVINSHRITYVVSN